MESSRPIRVTDVANNGKAITLADGSEWEIHFIDSIRSSLWLPNVTQVILRRDHRGPYPYTTVLEKVSSGFSQKVRAKKIQ